jgi:hypothetical protein
MGGRAIRIYLAEGTPNGLRTAEIGLSTCKAVMAPRVALDALSRRGEARRTGVYVLIGDDEQHAARRAVYVGEGDDVFVRIRKHDEEKDFWEHVVLFVSKDENLTKGHVRYLEARLIQIATSARRATVMNGTAPEPPKLPEADVAEMEEFLEQTRMLASVLGVTVFETADASSSTTSVAPNEPTLSLSGEGYEARGVVRQGQIVVLKGSVARPKEAPSLSVSSRALRAELLDAGVLAKTPSGLTFSQDYAFDSASGAAQVINGANVNGRTSWRLADGRTLKQWQDEQLPESSS